MSSIIDPADAARRALRARLLAAREQFVTGPEAAPASEALARHLAALLMQLEPDSLGLYSAMRSEFNPRLALDLARTAAGRSAPWSLALPWCRREPRKMHYRGWDGGALTSVDECRIPASAGAEVVPDVVLAPCVGYTASGHRLGYGGGYFDRWLARHPHATAIGVAWSAGAVPLAEFAPRAHDMPLLVIVTQDGLLTP